MGTIDIDSVPPATMTSEEPPRMRSAARAMAWSPEEQKRLMVIAEVSTGKPARKAAMRATFMPCSPSGMAQPRMTSSTSLASRPGTRARASLMASAARSSGRVERREPLWARPTGVRTAETITASGMGTSGMQEDDTASRVIGRNGGDSRFGRASDPPPRVFLRKNVILGELWCADAQECDFKPFRTIQLRFVGVLRGLEFRKRERNTRITSQGSTVCLLCQYEY